jgi:hypothetical protein
MKIRTGFVSNSSSSSFIVPTKRLSIDQIEAIKDHINYAKKMNWTQFNVSDYDWWSIQHDEENNLLILKTSMNNFDMGEFLTLLGVNSYYEN